MVDYTLLVFIFFNVFTFTFAFLTIIYIQKKHSEAVDNMLKALIARNGDEYKRLVVKPQDEKKQDAVVPDLIPTDSLTAEELIDIQNKTTT